MKKMKTYLLAAIVLVTVASCHQQKETADLSDSEKLEVLDLQLEHHPKDPHLYAERALVHFNLGRLKEAQADIEHAVELDSKNVDYRLRQADIYLTSGNIENSYKALSEAEKLDPDNKEVQLKLGEVTLYGHDYDRALRHLDKVTSQEPDNITALTIKSYVHKEMGDTVSAVRLLTHVCDIDPENVMAFEELGVLYSLRHNPLAVEYLSAALRLNPNNTNAMYSLAMYYQETGNFVEAEKLYRQMLDVNPNSSDALNNLGYLEKEVYGDLERAAEYFDKALEADPDNREAQQNRELIIDK